MQSYVSARFLHGWTWCNLSCPWFEWIFKMSMNITQLPINGIIKFRKILQKFWKILKNSEKSENWIFHFSEIAKWDYLLPGWCQYETFPSSEHPESSWHRDTFGFEHFLSVRASFVTCSSVINDPLEFTRWYVANLMPKNPVFHIFENFSKSSLKYTWLKYTVCFKIISTSFLWKFCLQKLWNLPIFDHEWPSIVLSEKRYEN